MVLHRVAGLFLRFAEFVCGAVVLGLVAHFLHIRHKTGQGPRGREIYTEIVAALSVVLSLIWLVPFTAAFMHYPIDFIISFAWFAAFGALVNYLKHNLNCGGAFHWRDIGQGGACAQWKAAEAFSFLSAIFWLVSAILSIYVFHKVRGRQTDPVVTDATPRRSRFGRKAQV